MISRYNSLLGPALFFFAQGKFPIYSCTVENGEHNSVFVNYPKSHILYYDKCVGPHTNELIQALPKGKVIADSEEQYQCHNATGIM